MGKDCPRCRFALVNGESGTKSSVFFQKVIDIFANVLYYKHCRLEVLRTDETKGTEETKMKRNEYKIFKGIVEKADADDRIWWDGYYWIDLTLAQAKDIDKVLRCKGFIDTVSDCKGRKAHMLPSGMTFAYQD